MVSFLYRMPAGVPGDVNRAWHAIIEPQILVSNSTYAPTAYGVPLVMDGTPQAAVSVGGVVRAVQSSPADSTAGSIYGILVRPYPTQDYGPWPNNETVGTSTPSNVGGPADVLRFGYVTVLLSGNNAAVKGAPVFVFYSTPSGTHITGGFEAGSGAGSMTAPATSIAIPGIFMGPADSNGFVEISVNFGA